MADKFIPQMAGFYLDIVTVNDSYPFAIVKHEYPFSNRNKVQNQGMKSRTIKVECSFMSNPAITKGWDTDIGIFPTYQAHFNFLETIKGTRELFTFTHPEYGEIEGAVENIGTVDDDTQEFVSVSFDFVQQITTDEITFVRYIVPQQSAGFRSSTGVITAALEAAQKVSSNAAAFAGTVNTYKGKLNSYLNRITSLATSIINTVNYGTSLPGEVMFSINSAIDRVVQRFVTIRNSPASFINNCILGVRDLAAVFEGVESQYVLIMGASRVAFESAEVYTVDDANRQETARLEDVQTFDAAGNFKGGQTFPSIMTVQELEQSLFDVRELINDAVLINRQNQGLKDQANQLQQYINEIKLGRETLETQEIALQTLHTVTLSNGLSYQAAERILSMNPQIKNPTFANGSIKVPVPQQV